MYTCILVHFYALSSAKHLPFQNSVHAHEYMCTSKHCICLSIYIYIYMRMHLGGCITTQAFVSYNPTRNSTYANICVSMYFYAFVCKHAYASILHSELLRAYQCMFIYAYKISKFLRTRVYPGSLRRYFSQY